MATTTSKAGPTAISLDQFYEAVAENLMDFRTDRKPLIEGIHQIATKVTGLSYLQDKFADGTTGPLQDICPFTAMGTFNCSMTDANRKLIAAEIAKLLGIAVPVPNQLRAVSMAMAPLNSRW